MQFYDFENSIGVIINTVAKAFVRALDSELRENVGVTISQWKVMVILVRQNGLTQKDIADRLGLEGPTLIPVIDKMEKDGLVIRKVDSADRRNNRIYRTEKADALWDEMFNCAMRVRQSSVKNITDNEIQITKNALDKMLHNLRLEYDVEYNHSCADVVEASTKTGSVPKMTVPTDTRSSAETNQNS
jgi:MarR family transcriptional regulator, transcriptional regulator for hemolysin